MPKTDLLREYIRLKVLWWDIVDSVEHPDWKREELFKLYQKLSKKELTRRIECLKSKINHAKSILDHIADVG